jgi:hypothetical protein
MTRMKIYQLRRRGTCRFVLASPLDTSLSATCRGALRKLEAGKTELDPDAAVAAAFTIEDFAGDDERGPGFYLLLSADDTAALEAGARYLADAIYTTGGEDYVAGSWIVEVIEPATVAAA